MCECELSPPEHSEHTRTHQLWLTLSQGGDKGMDAQAALGSSSVVGVTKLFLEHSLTLKSQRPLWSHTSTLTSGEGMDYGAKLPL